MPRATRSWPQLPRASREAAAKLPSVKDRCGSPPSSTPSRESIRRRTRWCSSSTAKAATPSASVTDRCGCRIFGLETSGGSIPNASSRRWPRYRRRAQDAFMKNTGDPKKLLSDWRGEVIARIRTLIEQADPEMIEEQKWKKPSNGMVGIPVWSHNGMVCTGETYKNYVKVTFAKGAELKDPSGLFNASLAGNTRRAIDIHEGGKIDEAAFKDLIRAAVALNSKGESKPRKAPGKRPATRT